MTISIQFSLSVSVFMERTDTGGGTGGGAGGGSMTGTGFDMIDDLNGVNNGNSYMRFNHLTPPRRVPVVQHYYS